VTPSTQCTPEQREGGDSADRPGTMVSQRPLPEAAGLLPGSLVGAPDLAGPLWERNRCGAPSHLPCNRWASVGAPAPASAPAPAPAPALVLACVGIPLARALRRRPGALTSGAHPCSARAGGSAREGGHPRALCARPECASQGPLSPRQRAMCALVPEGNRGKGGKGFPCRVAH